MYLNLEGAATFILASVKYLRDKSLVSNCYSFNMYQWRLAAIKWKKEAMCPTEVWGLRNNAPIALERVVRFSVSFKILYEWDFL